MSRLAKKPIMIPEKVKVAIEAGNFTVTGPLGNLILKMNSLVNVKISDNQIELSSVGSSLRARALLGTYASHIKNMVAGVVSGFKKQLLIEGVGFKVAQAGNTLTFNLGFSHPIKVEVPKTLKVTTDKGEIHISGASKEEVGQFSAEIRALKKPEPYKGKGIRYSDEVILRKQGKKVVA